MSEEFIQLDMLHESESRIKEITALYKTAFAGEPWHDDWSDEVQLTEYIKEVSCGYNALNFGLVADGKLIAVSLGRLSHWWEGANYIIEEFCVSPDLQGQGTGTRFMKMIEDEVRKRDVAGIFLQTDNDKPSYKFYQKNGFINLSAHVSLFKKL